MRYRLLNYKYALLWDFHPTQKGHMTENTQKVCTRCKEPLPLTAFCASKSGRNGLRADCKPCHAAQVRTWQKANPVRVKATKAAYHIANADHLNAQSRAWGKANPERRRASVAAWQKANPDKVRINGARWRARHPDRVKAANDAYRAKIAMQG